MEISGRRHRHCTIGISKALKLNFDVTEDLQFVRPLPLDMRRTLRFVYLRQFSTSPTSCWAHRPSPSCPTPPLSLSGWLLPVVFHPPGVLSPPAACSIGTITTCQNILSQSPVIWLWTAAFVCSQTLSSPSTAARTSSLPPSSSYDVHTASV